MVFKRMIRALRATERESHSQGDATRQQEADALPPQSPRDAAQTSKRSKCSSPGSRPDCEPFGSLVLGEGREIFIVQRVDHPALLATAELSQKFFGERVTSGATGSSEQ